MSARRLALALLIAAGAVFLAWPAFAAPPKPAAPVAAKKVTEVELLQLRLFQTVDENTALKQQVVQLQKDLIDARAELQAVKVAEERRRVLQKAGVGEGQRVDLATGEIQAAPPPERK